MHVLVVVEPPAPAAQSLEVASGVGAPLSTSSFGFTLSLFTRQRNGTVSPPRPAKERARFLADLAATIKEPQ
jgi:hypothetical protein